MFTFTALVSIMSLYIILILVLVLLVRKENSAIGHTWSRAGRGRLEAANAA